MHERSGLRHCVTKRSNRKLEPSLYIGLVLHGQLATSYHNWKINCFPSYFLQFFSRIYKKWTWWNIDRWEGGSENQSQLAYFCIFCQKTSSCDTWMLPQCRGFFSEYLIFSKIFIKIMCDDPLKWFLLWHLYIIFIQ